MISFAATSMFSCSCDGAELVIYTLNSFLRQVYKALQRHNQPLSKNNYQHSRSGLKGWLLARGSSETVSTCIFMAVNITRPPLLTSEKELRLASPSVQLQSFSGISPFPLLMPARSYSVCPLPSLKLFPAQRGAPHPLRLLSTVFLIGYVEWLTKRA